MKAVFCKMYNKIKYTPLTLISIGLLLIIVISVVESYPNQNSIRIIGHTILLLFKEIGLAFVIAGGVTIVIELNDFMEYFLRRLTDVMVNEKYIDLLTTEQQRKIRKILDRKLFFPNSIEDPSSFFYTVEEEVIPLLNQCYYEEYAMIIECIIDEANGLTYKTTYKTIKVVNPTNQKACEEIPIWNYMSKIDTYQDDLFKLIQLTVNGQDKTEEFQLEATPIEFAGSEYNILYHSDKTIEIEDCSVITYKTETVVPIHDIQYHHRLSKPCKKYHITYLLPDCNYHVVGQAFGFGVKGDEENVTKQILKNGICITFDDWTLPGDGIIFTILKNI